MQLVTRRSACSSPAMSSGSCSPTTARWRSGLGPDGGADPVRDARPDGPHPPRGCGCSALGDRQVNTLSLAPPAAPARREPASSTCSYGIPYGRSLRPWLAPPTTPGDEGRVRREPRSPTAALRARSSSCPWHSRSSRSALAVWVGRVEDKPDIVIEGATRRRRPAEAWRLLPRPSLTLRRRRAEARLSVGRRPERKAGRGRAPLVPRRRRGARPSGACAMQHRRRSAREGQAPEDTPRRSTGDFVLVVNAEKVAVTGKKLDGQDLLPALRLTRAASASCMLRPRSSSVP